MFWVKHLFTKKDFPVTDAEFSAGASAAPQAPGPGSESDGDPRFAELEARLGAVSAEAERQREEWLRAKAETDNVRRRGQEDVAKAHRFGIGGFFGGLLAVKDSLDAA